MTEPIKSELAIHKKLTDHDKILEEHELQLKMHSDQIKNLENSTLRLENLVMNENRETRQTIINTNSQLHDLITNIMGFNVTKHKQDINLKIARTESIAKIIGILAGSGGILYYIFGGN